MPFSDAVEAPVIYRDVTIPKLKLRDFGTLAAKAQAARIKKFKAQLSREEGTPEAKSLLVVREAAREYGVEDVWDWAATLDGSRETLATAMNGQAVKLDIETISPADMRDLALELVDHPNSPSRRAKRIVEWEAKTAAERQTAKEDEEKKSQDTA